MILTDGRVGLGTFERFHCDAIYFGWFRNPMVRRFIKNRPATLRAARRYVEARLRDQAHCQFFSVYLGSHRVGTLKIEESNTDPRIWWLGVMIGDKSAQGHGVGPRAIWLACCYAFDRLAASEIVAGISRDNVASIKAFQKAGFMIGYFPGRPADVLAWKRR